MPESVQEHDISLFTEYLRAVDFFKCLSEEDLLEIASVCSSHQYEKGSLVFMEGDKADRFYIILEGQVEVWKAYGRSDQGLLARHGAGHFFGEMALIDDLPRSASLLATAATKVLCIEQSDFRHLIRENGAIAQSLLLSISAMVRSSNDTFFADLKEKNIHLQKANAELKAAQEEKLRNERLSTIGKFASVVLHDIRNPLGVIKALGDLMVLHAEDPLQVLNDVVRLKNEVERMERMTQEILDYSRGEIRLDLRIITAEHLIKKFSESVKDRLERSGIKLMVYAADTGHFLVDEDRFLRILFNLAENSRKAMQKGQGGIITLSVSREKDYIITVFSDNGEGMSEEVLVRVFEPFFSKSGAGGTGLGMMIVKNLVEAHEGDIEIHSAPGKGTEIRIRIPARV